MGGCSKTLRFVITIITWWVGVTKKWNCPLLFVTNLWCSHFFLQKRNFSTSQARKKSCLFFKQKACWFWTIVKQKNASLFCTTVLLSWQKEKKTSDLVCLFFAFFILESWKKKQLCLKRQVFSVCFFWPWANFALNKISRVLSFKSKLCKERLCFSFPFFVSQTTTRSV